MTGLLRRSNRPSMVDDGRFAQLYEDTSQDLLAFLLRRCPTPEDAADCLNETYRIAWEKRTRIPAGDEARPWLFGVARNVARMESRNTSRRAAASHELARATDAASTLTPARHSEVTEALAELSALDRDIVLMLSAGDLTPREVAGVLALSPNAVRVRAHRAREKLRRLLAESASADSEPQDALPAAPGAVP